MEDCTESYVDSKNGESIAVSLCVDRVQRNRNGDNWPCVAHVGGGGGKGRCPQHPTALDKTLLYCWSKSPTSPPPKLNVLLGNLVPSVIPYFK